MGFIPPVQKGIAYYSTHGELPDTPFWNKLEHRFEANPERFMANHGVIGGLFVKAGVIGEMPDTPYWDNLRDRFELNSARFEHYHPFLGKIMERDYEARHQPPIIIPPIGPITPENPGLPGLPGTGTPPPDNNNPGTPAVPEPASFVTLAIGILAVFLGKKLWF